ASNVEIQAVESEEKAAEALTPVVQTVQAVSSSVSPLIKRTQTSATPVAKDQVTPIISSTAVPLVATAQIPQAAPVSPAPEVKTIESTKPSEQTASKIIKIYPVYDAIGSAIRHIYSAAQDMINYTYSLVTTSTKPAVSDVKISITEK
ncbi:MAG: hypothetical protein U0945_08160, partial [Flavobacterium sp.]|nr:hypothetical protein [Flavobacterium sp.]